MRALEDQEPSTLSERGRACWFMFMVQTKRRATGSIFDVLWMWFNNKLSSCSEGAAGRADKTKRQSKVIEVKSVVVLFVGFLSGYIQILSSTSLNLPKIKSQNTHNTIKDRFDWFHVLFSNFYRYLINSVIVNFLNCDNHVVKIDYCDKTLQKLTKHYQQNVNK